MATLPSRRPGTRTRQATETDEDFQSSAELIRHCRFKNSFIFKYSPRPGTVAIDRFADDVPEDVKRRRNNELLAVQQEVCNANNRRMIGRTVEVLVEGESKLVNKPAYPAAPAYPYGYGATPAAVAPTPAYPAGTRP